MVTSAQCLTAFAAFVHVVRGLSTVNSTTPGEQACAHILASIGSAKVQQPGSTSFLASQAHYWNAKQSDYVPSCAVYPTCAEDVSVVIKAAGGHNPNTFYSSVQNGVLIDLTQLNARSYDNCTELGSYGPGGTFGDVYDYFQQFGRTVVGARLAAVGTGLALGGGLSFLSSQYGLACDSFRELQMVLPDGNIVIASPTQHPDLFFAARGGGGNAYGVVTRYTVQTRPSGTFFAGNIFYSGNQTEAVIKAIQNFMRFNQDPKASIIGTVEKNGGVAVSSTNLMFLVYDGPNPGRAFDNFTSIPYLSNTMGTKNYSQVVNLPFPGTAELSRGDNVFRVQVHRLKDDKHMQAYQAWTKWCEDNKGNISLSSLDYQPVPKSLTDASNAQNGGNAMQMPSGPWFWLNFLISTVPGLSDEAYNAVQASFRDMVNSVPNAKGLPLFINDANYDQKPLRTFSTYHKLQAIKKKYDADNFFANYTGGWSFD